MADERRHIDDVFTEALRGYTEVPPPQAWSALEAKLDQKGGRRRIAWWWYVVAGVTLVSTGFLLIRGKDNHQPITRSNGKEATAVQLATNNGATATVPSSTTIEPSSKAMQPAREVAIAAPLMERASGQDTKEIPTKRTTATAKAFETADSDSQQSHQTTVPHMADAATRPGNAEPRAIIRPDDIIEPMPIIQNHKELDDNIRHRTGVVMNIKVLPPITLSAAPIDSEIVAKANGPDTIMAPQSENHGPLKKSELLVSAEDKYIPSYSRASAPEIITADSIVTAIAKSLTAETESLIAATQDAIVLTGPSAMVEPVTFVQPAPGSDGFIGPMPDASMYASLSPVLSDTGNVNKSAYKVNLEGFLKAGYERGFGEYTLNKLVFASMLKLNLSPKLSLVLQPTLKAGELNKFDVALGSRDSVGNLITAYHNIKSSVVDSYKLYSTWSNAQGIIYDSVKAQYYYRQTYDSISVNSTLQAKTLYEIELPLLLNYQFSKKISVYAGPTINYSKIAWVDANMKIYEGLVRADTLTYYTSRAASQQISGPKISEVIQYNTPDYNKIEYPYVGNPTENRLRMGIILGGTINVNNKLTFDILMQQNLSRMNYIPASQVKGIYLQPYFRFMLGYKVFGSGKK